MNIKIEKPSIKNAKDIYALVLKTKVLDVNSEYLYLLQSTHFSNECSIATLDKELVGFVSGYVLPRKPDTFFVWQVGVDNSMRGAGLASRMIEDILQREHLQNILYIHTTISPSNQPSQRVFEKLATKLGVAVEKEIMFEIDDFIKAHEEEVLYKIGPIKRKTNENI